LLRKRVDLLVSVGILLLVVWMVWDAQAWTLRARLFPWTIGIPSIFLALMQVGFATKNLLRHEEAPAATAPDPRERPPVLPPEERQDEDSAVMARAVESAFGAGSAAAEEEEIPSDVARRRTIEMVAWIIAFALGVTLFGFRLGAAIVTFGFLRFGARESWKTTGLITLGTYLFFFVVFDWGLNTPFPEGAIADALDTNAFDEPLTDGIKRLAAGLFGGGQ
jgi:hypothetical protein